MILTALREYYRRLEEDPEATVVPAGHSRQKLTFRVNLTPDGGLAAFEPLGEMRGSKRVPERRIVPGSGARNGTQVIPNVLWDNAGYMLGFRPDDPNPDRTAETFAAFRDRHLELEPEIDDPAFAAVCRFLEGWDPAGAGGRHPELAEAAAGFGVFRLAGETAHVHERPAFRAWWAAQLRAGAAATVAAGGEGQCLLSGEVGPIARTHVPKIKGVNGAQPSGALLVSFNFDATESYGRSQGENAPVGEAAAFEYAVALNRLLDRDGGHRVQVGDAAVLFWTGRPVPAESALPVFFDPPSEDGEVSAAVAAALTALRKGTCPPELGDPATPFYLLGLSPNAGRLSVRFWRESTLGEFVSHAHRHYADLEIARGPKEKAPEFPPVWWLLAETARESKDVSPLLSGGLLSAILDGTPYPRSFLSALVRRTRADRDIRVVRAGALKACLNRDLRRGHSSPLSEELPVALDPDRPEPAYQLGRLFSALEKSQEDALPGLNATIKDRYFGAASATPGTVFPRLIRMNQHHLGKLDNRGHKIAHERRIQQICDHIDGFPGHLSLPEQGLFAVGYYHQRQDLFTKKTADEPESPAPAETPAEG